MRLILVGNPNCGKSTLFNALTGGHAKTGNWHGVTVGVSSRVADLAGERAQIADLPGLYSLQTYSMEEKFARTEIESGRYDLAVCVADALTLSRSLELLSELCRRGMRVALVVTMRDLLERQGGFLKVEKLSERLGIPVLAVALHRRGEIERLRIFLRDAARGSGGKGRAEFDPKSVLEGVYYAGERRIGLPDKLLYNPVFALPLFSLILLGVFFLAFAKGMPGVICKQACERFVAETLGGYIAAAVERSGAAVAADFVRSLCSSVGMLVSFLPQIALLHLALALLEESGFLSILAFLTDGLFRRVGLTGRAVFSILMGFGCTAAAILTTRGLENARLQRRVIGILSFVSCSAKLPVYLSLAASFFSHPFWAVVAVYTAGVLLAFAAALVFKHFSKAEEEFLLEMAHLQRPCLRLVLKSLLFSVKQFIMKIATVVMAFLIVVWFLLSFSFSFCYVGVGSENSMLAVCCRGIAYLFYPMGIRQWQVALSAVSGLVAKESVAGMLTLFYGNDWSAAMSAPAAAAFSAFMLACSPCVSAIAASAREVGLRRALFYAAGQTAFAFGLGYLVYGLLCGGAAVSCVLALAAPVAAIVLWRKRGKRHEKICCAQSANSKRFHRRKLRARLVRLFPSSARPRYSRLRRSNGEQRILVRGR